MVDVVSENFCDQLAAKAQSLEVLESEVIVN